MCRSSSDGGRCSPTTTGLLGFLTWSPSHLGSMAIQGLPYCSSCTGCTNSFAKMPSEVQAFNHNFKTAPGASRAAVSCRELFVNKILHARVEHSIAYYH